MLLWDAAVMPLASTGQETTRVESVSANVLEYVHARMYWNMNWGMVAAKRRGHAYAHTDLSRGMTYGSDGSCFNP